MSILNKIYDCKNSFRGGRNRLSDGKYASFSLTRGLDYLPDVFAHGKVGGILGFIENRDGGLPDSVRIEKNANGLYVRCSNRGKVLNETTVRGIDEAVDFLKDIYGSDCEIEVYDILDRPFPSDSRRSRFGRQSRVKDEKPVVINKNNFKGTPDYADALEKSLSRMWDLVDEESKRLVKELDEIEKYMVTPAKPFLQRLEDHYLDAIDAVWEATLKAEREIEYEMEKDRY